MIPISGEQHERAVGAARDARRVDDRSVDDLESTGVAIDAYLASLREQGVVLVDLGEVVAWLRGEDKRAGQTWRAWGRVADAIERRFGGNERSE